MSAPTDFWSRLIEINKYVDGLIDRTSAAARASQPISREIPFFAQIEARFDNLPDQYAATINPACGLLAGNNIRQPIYNNGGSRVYIREIGIVPYRASSVSTSNDVLARRTDFRRFPINYRWNFTTSITNRQYANLPVMARAAGSARAGTHLAFREPLIIEPRETFQFYCELLSFGMNDTAERDANYDTALISMSISGYREGV